MRVLITRSTKETDSCYLHRIKPYENISDDEIEFVIDNTLDRAWEYDAIMLQRPSHEILPVFIKDYQKDGKLVVVETDDDLLSVPPSNPVWEYYRQNPSALHVYKECIKLCDYLSVSTPELLSKQGEVFCNAADSQPPKSFSDRDIDVLWAGSPTHAEDLEMVRPALMELSRKKKKVVLMSNREWLCKIFPESMTAGWGTYEEYMNMIARSRVFVIPLKDNRFNRAKSELKCVEAASRGTAAVCSPVAPYVRFRKTGGNVLVKKERHREWLRAVESLLDNEYLWGGVSARGMAANNEVYNLTAINEKRKTWWKQILKA